MYAVQLIHSRTKNKETYDDFVKYCLRLLVYIYMFKEEVVHETRLSTICSMLQD